MVFQQLSFGVTPEALEPIDVHFSPAKTSIVVDSQVLVTIERQRIVRMIFIGVNERPALNELDGLVHQRASTHVWNYGYLDLAFSLQNSEHRNFAGGTAPSPAFAASAEVRLIRFDFTAQELRLLFSEHRAPDNRVNSQHSRIADTELRGRLPGSDLQFEELDQPKPFHWGNPRLSEPCAGQLTKGVATTCAPVPTLAQTVQPLRITIQTAPISPAPAAAHEISRSGRIASNQLIEFKDSHGTRSNISAKSFIITLFLI